MRTKRIYIFVILAVCLTTILIILQSNKSNPTPNVNIQASPTTSTILLDGKTKIRSGNVYITPGLHTIKGSFPGFADRQVGFTAADGKSTNVVLLLVPNSAIGYQWLVNHPTEASLRDSIGSHSFEQAQQQRLTNLPLMKDLPYIERYFRIDYGPSKAYPNDSSRVALYITTFGQPGVQQALDWIKNKGYNPDTLEIIYSDQSGS